MAYQVLARKWRPHNFPEMIGQTHVVRALTNALENNRLHHAYLFTGTRGVGKTTIARILAKSLNCETKGVTAYPCGECHSCREVDEGRFVDLIEVDAASRTKVEDTRDLLENVQYAPTRGRYKVYLIDEVHMLSTSSFNALLKTLEEPPAHVKFLLATTDPQKLPPTVLSRCLQFSLKRLQREQIYQHLTKILDSEQINYDEQGLRLLAQAADGSVRDSLSLLDQAIAFSGGNVSGVEVSHMLGTLDQDVVLDLVTALANNNAEKLLLKINQLAEKNPDFTTVLSDILSILQQIALVQILPAAIDKNDSHAEAILTLTQQLSPEDVQLFYQIGLIGRRDLPLSPEPKGGFEMIMLRMLAFRPAAMIQNIIQSPQNQTITPPQTHQTVAHSTPSIAPSTTPLPTDEWTNIISKLPTTSGMVKQLAQNCSYQGRQSNTISLILSPKHEMFRRYKGDLEKALSQLYSEEIHLDIKITQQNTTIDTPVEQQRRVQETQNEYLVNTISSDPFVKLVKETCDAKVKITPKEE